VIAVTHDPPRRTFTAHVEGHEAYLRYLPSGDGVLDYASTYVPDGLRGRGIASAIVRQALDYARAEGYRVSPSCWFVRDFLRKHPEYADLSVEDRQGR
jgi:predicted GNAT family acetyltransferase